MNQRLHNLSKWRFLPEGESIAYPGRRQRTVILEVNCPSEVGFFILQNEGDISANPERLADEAAGRAAPPGMPDVARSSDEGGPVSFLGLAKGRDRFEFGVDGAFELFCEGGSAYVYTADGQDVATRVVAPLIFTKIANRRARNPQLELMQYQMRLNQQRFMEQLAAESERRIGDVERRVASYATERNIGTPIRKPPEGVSERIEPLDETERLDPARKPPVGAGKAKKGKSDPAGTEESGS